MTYLPSNPSLISSPKLREGTNNRGIGCMKREKKRKYFRELLTLFFFTNDYKSFANKYLMWKSSLTLSWRRPWTGFYMITVSVMKELSEVRVPPTLLPTEKRQYLQPKAKKKKKKKYKSDWISSSFCVLSCSRSHK